MVKRNLFLFLISIFLSPDLVFSKARIILRACLSLHGNSVLAMTTKLEKMHTSGFKYVAAAFMLVASVQVFAEKATTYTGNSRPSLHATDVKKFDAIVTDINYEMKRVKLTDAEGRSVVLTIDPQARNFDQVSKGDRVIIETVESIAIKVTPNGESPGADSILYVDVPKAGEKPHGVAVQTRQISAIVEDIDYQARTVTLRGPEGNLRRIRVDPVAKRFNEVKKGDLITFKLTEAIALSVSKPAEK